MSKSNNVYKDAFNRGLRLLDETKSLPSEPELGTLLGVSRTTVRSILSRMEETGLIAWNKRNKTVLRSPGPEDFFPEEETDSLAEIIERSFMRRLLAEGAEAGMQINELELAREIGVGTTSVREFLIGFSSSGLIEKKPRGGWRLCAFDRSFAMELADVRQMFEFAAIEHFAKLAPTDAAVAKVDELIARHEKLGSVMPRQHKDFPALDRDFHTFLIDLLNNRFAQGFYDIVSLVFHYHYQWDKDEELARNQYAVQEHLAILRALARRDFAGARKAMRTHLDSSRSTLLQSIRARELKVHPN